MEKLHILLITIYLVKIYQCTSNQTLNKQYFLANSVETNTTALLNQLPKIIQNTSFDIKHSSDASKQNNISTIIKEDYEQIPVFINKGNYLSYISSDVNNTKNLLQFRKSQVKNMSNNVTNYRKSKNTVIDNTNSNFDITNSTFHVKDLQSQIKNNNETEENIDDTNIQVTDMNLTGEVQNLDKMEDEENVTNQNENASEIQNNITLYNVSEPTKIKILNITANLEITLQNNLHKILGSLKAEKGKYLLPHLMDKFESTVLRPIKDTLDTIHIELSPEYNNNYGSQIQPSTPLFLQKLQEKKQKILNHFGIRCCNYDYPYPY